MKNTIAAWVLAVTLVAAIAVVNVSSHRDPQAHYLDVSRPRLLLADPGDPVDPAMAVDRDDPLVDRHNTIVPAMPELGTDSLADRPVVPLEIVAETRFTA